MKTALTPQVFIMIGIILTAGSMIVTWLGEQITDKGYGNGVSMIIFAGIVASIPEMIQGHLCGLLCQTSQVAVLLHLSFS